MDLKDFFEQNPYINISQFAKLCGINSGLMRKYAIGLHKPSKRNCILINIGINKIIQNLCKF